MPEFIAGLPQDVVCASSVWSQHAYIGGDDPVEPVAQALAARGCPHRSRSGSPRPASAPRLRTCPSADAIADEQEGCRKLHERLVTWFNDPRVTVAFQYTLREDDKFPTGLFSTDLSTPRPTLGEWAAWGGGRDPLAPPPPSAC